jgi:gliding motility-associated-like protein
MLLFFITVTACAQKRNNVWAFGIKSGLNFNTDPVSLFKSAIDEPSPPYFISSICDTAGNLLFYTDGIKVWNTYNQVLPKYKNWWPWSHKVLPLVCQYPSNDSLYYLFGIDNGLHSGELMYLTIKMKNADEYNELVYPTPVSTTSFYKVLAGNLSMALAGTTHCNGKDFWITTHAPGKLESYLVNSSGVSPVPVITSVQGDVLPVQQLDLGNSNIRFSANGERMIVPVFGSSSVAVFDFDNQSGKFSNPIVLRLPEGNYLEDVEISPDASKLYLAAYEKIDVENQVELHYLYQMDLNAGSSSEIQKTLFKINDPGDRAACSPRGSCIYVKRTMQLGPDGKIYVGMKEYTSTNLDRSLSVIEAPDKSKLNARYRKNFIDLRQQYKYINYNYVRSSSFSLKENGIKVQKKTCSDQPVEFGLLFSRIDSVRWDFGDPAAGNNNYSSLASPLHQYPSPGSYMVKAVIYDRCLTDTTFATVTIQPDKSVRVPEFIKDSSVCIGAQLSLDATTAFATTYRWENGLIYPNRTIDQEGSYQVTVMNDCSIDHKSFDVVYKECECSVFIPTAFTPNGDALNDVFKPVFRCFVKDYRLKIFNRYGEMIFETRQINTGWNGKIGGSPLSTGIYIWTLQYKNPNTDEFITKKGTLTLIR